ncbi:hypothetical protein [Actinomadura rayongensis]|uniref:PKD domain containing protein n=1 Tax=Actinomadura rayongensis TaxID=1429076 RepID=A0A6I4W2Q9_9ACTN|nr:hypothetical protein [Actinomadura rayongensis]MXQ64477.1 hypothetical protein [Actinomadura rayongensis]
MRKRSITATVTVLSVLTTTLVPTFTANADIAQSAVVSANPVDNTPHVLDGTVRAIAVVGTKVIVGGDFEEVREASSATKIKRHNLFAYDMGTGKIDTAFVPKVDGSVHTLQAGTSSSVYAGGTFTHVGATKTGTLVRLKATDGGIVPTFKPAVDYRVYTMVRRGSRLYIGGTFTKAGGAARASLARLDAITGAADPTFTLKVSDPRQGALKVYRLAVNPADSRLIINGTFTKVNGLRRYQIAMIDTKSSPAKLTTWATEKYATPCNTSSFDTYMRGMDFSPDGSYFVVVTTGGPYGTSQLCDSAARWETDRTGSGQSPTWVDWTGGDTLLSTSVTGVAVYVGGHQRWLNNPYGHDFAGPGAVSRPGIAALSPTTGKPLSWNPTRTLGHGVEALVATPNGLLVGSDTDQLGKEYHGRIGMFPLG